MELVFLFLIGGFLTLVWLIVLRAWFLFGLGSQSNEFMGYGCVSLGGAAFLLIIFLIYIAVPVFRFAWKAVF